MKPTVDLRTARYQDHQSIIESGLVPTRITLGAPRWKLKYELLANLTVLAPTREIFRIEDPEEFEMAYRAKLDEAGVDVIAGEVASISAAHGGRGLALLCFEDITKLGEFSCHRRSFARWWEEQTGQVVTELGVTDLVRDPADGNGPEIPSGSHEQQGEEQWKMK